VKRRVVLGLALLALAGCAQMPAQTAVHKEKAPNEVISFELPPDALGARDPQLSAVLAKAGALAAAQAQPTVVLVTALGQDFAYVNQAVWKGVPAQRAVRVSFENRAVPVGQPYSVSIRTVQ
jgi:type IV pilus biogenesis protein CpaD/CtpE